MTALPRLPRDSDGPVFAEPWQAQAFALAVTLSKQGHFTWKEWAAALAHELDAAANRGEPDDGSHYYEHWLAALEQLVTAKRLTDAATLLRRKEAWVTAYRTTPHGRPVELPPSRNAGLRWLVLGLAGTVATYWALGSASSDAPALGLTASAGLGTLLGMKHAIEPDHLAAVSTLMTGERSSARAALLGACWGLGHTLTLLATGALLVVLHTEMPGAAVLAFEIGVVLLLIVFGVRAICLGLGRGLGTPTHTHGPPARARLTADRWTLARPLLIGAVHGLAGSGALTALVVTTLPSSAAQLGYLTLFGAGSILGMAALSGLLGWPIARLGTHH
jgi:nitrile hydratase accessory protein